MKQESKTRRIMPCAFSALYLGADPIGEIRIVRMTKALSKISNRGGV